MDPWLQVLLGVGAVLTPFAIAAMARDRALMSTIARGKEDAATMIQTQAGQLHERINRVRDEYVRRDDLEGHMTRTDKQRDDMRGELRRMAENTEKRLEELRKLLSR